MIIDSHEHIFYSLEMQLEKMGAAGVDKAVLFCAAPHPEKARSLSELEKEMTALNKILAGACSSEEKARRLKKNNAQVEKAVKKHPERFLGFGAVPLGLGLKETKAWVKEQVMARGFCGIGEFTPGSPRQIAQLEPIFQALLETKVYPVWVHTFHPVTVEGLRILMSLCEKYPGVPVIFGHLGGVNWMEVIKFAKGQRNAYLDLSAAFSSLAARMALTELPEKCLYSSDAPYGEPYLCRQLIEFVSPSRRTAELALGENIAQLLALDCK